MSNDLRISKLFAFERHGGWGSVFLEDASLFIRATGQAGRELDENHASWQAEKRHFTMSELLAGRWVKVSDRGKAYVLTLHEDGTLTEASLFAEEETWRGTWELHAGGLILRIGEYELPVIAVRDGEIHSGLEYVDGKIQPVAYFKVIHVR